MQHIQRKHSFFSLPWSTDWGKLFGAVRPLIIEIGFGNGDHLLHLAQSYPDYNVIGFEIANQSMEKAERKIQNSGLMNCVAVHSRGETALYHLFEPACIAQVHINYPDPWFKKRHEGRRLMQRDTLDAIVNRLETGGTFHLGTDIREYAEMSHALLQETPGLDNLLDAPWVNEMPGRFTTKYEQKGYREGRPAHFFIYRRNQHPAPDVPVIKDLDMPHIILTTPMSPAEIMPQFQKFTAKHGDIASTVLRVYADYQQKTLLFEVNVDEPTILQHVSVVMTERENPNEYLLRLGSMGVPRPTRGLHHVVAAIADWLVSLHPEAQLVARKVKLED